MTDRYAIDKTRLMGIASAVRDMRHEKGLLTPAQIEAKIRASHLGIPIVVSNHIDPETGEWERPADWPDIDTLAAKIEGDQDCLYLTYDLRKTPGYGWIGIYAKTIDDTAWTATRGHVESGAFVADELIDIESNGYLRRALIDDEGSVQLWRITSLGHITSIGFVTNTATNAENLQNNLQPCVQRAGTLPWCMQWGGAIGINNNQVSGGTQWLERDALMPGKLAAVTNLSSCWSGCYSLQSLDLSGWDTTNWAVTNLSSCWYCCYSLQNLKGPETWTWISRLSNNTNNPNLPQIEHFDGIPLSVNHDYNAALKLTIESLVKIIDVIPIVTVARTLALGQTNKNKLTAAQIATATQKGWTIA